MSKTPNFEQSIQSLEGIVNQLEHGELSLDDALKQFEAGIGLARVCQTLLSDAEKKITTLTDPSLLPANPSDAN